MTSLAPKLQSRGNDFLAALILLALAAAWLLAWRGTGHLPLAWVLLRATGLASYLALALSVIFGVLTASPAAPSWLGRAISYGWHGLLSGFALVTGAIHGAFLLVDGQYPQTLSAVLLPGDATFKPLEVGLGTLGLEALALVYVSTLLRTRLPRPFWKKLHLLAYPVFVLTTLHGLYLGSDHAWPLYLVASVAALLTLGLRLLSPSFQPRRSQ